MAYSTLQDVYNSARFRTGTSTADFSDANTSLIALANKHYRQIMSALVETNEDWYSTIATASLSSGVSAYTLGSDSSIFGGSMVRIQRVEITYDGTEWQVARPLDFEQISTPTATITDINNEFSASEPYYAIYGNTIRTFPVPTANVSAGLRMFYVKRQPEMFVTNASSSSVQVWFNEVVSSASYASTVTETVLPKEFLGVLEEYITGDIYERIGKIQEATVTRQSADAMLEQMKRTWSPRNQDFDLNMGSNAFEDYGE